MLQQRQDWIGRTLANTYRVERELGSGGMGAVYLVRHLRTGGYFAAKVLRADIAGEATVYRRFQDEASTTSALRHPNIVQVTDFNQDEQGNPFLVMELLDGEDLSARLHRTGPLPVATAVALASQVGSALQAAHEIGVIHRDIKPKNIFLVRHRTASGVLEVAKVVDFGISKIKHSGTQMTRDHVLMGTPEFMSPEAALGQNSQLDGRTDQFSLAVMIYLMLSGRLPFVADHPMGVLYRVVNDQPPSLLQLVPGLPKHVADATDRAMRKSKEDRFPTVMDFVQALNGADQFQAGPDVDSTVPMERVADLMDVADPAPTRAGSNLISPTVLSWQAPPLVADPSPPSTLSGTNGQKLSPPSSRRRLLSTGAVVAVLACTATILIWPYHKPAGSRPVLVPIGSQMIPRLSPVAPSAPPTRPVPVPAVRPEVTPKRPGAAPAPAKQGQPKATPTTAAANARPPEKVRPKKPRRHKQEDSIEERPTLDADL